MNFHLIGIGGAGMSVIAHLLNEQGHVVSGSDKNESLTLENLREKGVKVFVGHDETNVPNDCVVVVSTAITKVNPEYAYAKDKGLEIWHRSQALDFVARSKKMIAVAGAHGKTTTSGMFAFVLNSMGLDPSYAVGSTIKGLGKGGYAGKGDFFVAEADESDKSFLNYSPRLSIVTNVEADHLDNYADEQEFRDIFVEFANKILPNGALVVCRDDEGALELARTMSNKLRVITYGKSTSVVEGEYARVSITEEELNSNGAKAVFELEHKGEKLKQHIELQVSGAHNILNAAGVFAACFDLGLDLEKVAFGLKGFSGTGRRFELRGECAGVRIFDDYAHHPTEVLAALKQARIYAGEGRVAVIFQPHLYSRTINFAQDFAKSLSLADLAIVVDIFAAREEPVEGIDSSIITNYMDSEIGHYIPDKQEAAFFVSNWVCESDIIVTVGAGDITYLGDTIIEFLQGELF